MFRPPARPRESTVIRDAVHGDIELDADLVRIIDLPDFQRLRSVRQMAVAYLVFPSAHHSRFEHSLGTYHLSAILARRLIPDEDDRALAGLAGLLHDVGHSAFSHLSEPVVREATGKDHEQLGLQKIAHGEIGDALSKMGYSLRKLAALMAGRDRRGFIVSGDLGTDRMDYLLRDAYFCGVQYSVIDAQRLLATLALTASDGLSLPPKGVKAAESLLVSRYLMMTSVYLHHAVRIAQEMLRKALRTSLASDRIGVDDLVDGVDDYLLYAMARGGNPLAARITHRRLYKRAFAEEVALGGGREGAKALRDLDSALCGALGFEKYVVCPPQVYSSDIYFNVDSGRGMKRLVECSAVARALQSEKAVRTLIVATDAKDAATAQRIARRML